MLHQLKRKLFGRAHSRRGYRPLSEEQKHLRRIKLLRFGAIGALISVVGGMVLFFGAVAYYSRALPKPGEIIRRDGFSTQIVDRNDKLLYDLYDEENRTPITLDQVPEHLKHATIAIEDKDFYKHGGFDALTILRIPYNMIVRQRVIGGSTLTQQLVKNALLSNERTATRKLKELILSLQIERTFTKDEILAMYMNEVPFGGTAMGVGAASKVYFNKSVSDLTLLEAAILAGLPQRPSAYSPYLGQTDEDGNLLWQIRTTSVLTAMKEQGYITDLAYEEALSQMKATTFERAPVEIQAPHFVFYVREQLAEMYGEEVIDSAGFKVTTSLDLDLHNKAQQIVAEEVEKVGNLNISNGAAMIQDPQTGEIISMVGSRDYHNSEIGGQFNVVADGLRQPGSSIKPITYLSLLERGYTPASMLVDVPTTFTTNERDQQYTPKNYDGRFRGPVSVRNSLGNSLNITSVKALAIVGVPNFLQKAYAMGLETLEPTEANRQRFGLAVTLGGAEVHMVDLVSAYSAFANGGTKVEPVAILKVENKDGQAIYEHRQVQGAQVMDPGHAFLINHILSDNSARSQAFGPNSLLNVSGAVAVKTGTTNELKDNWAIGWSQDVIVGAWVGNNDNTQMRGVASGVSGASPIWRRIILAALESGFKSPAWEIPKNVEAVKVDAVSGYPEHDGFNSRTEYVVKNSLPSLPDPIHAKLKLCRGQNRLATDAQVAANDFEEKEFIVLKETDPLTQDGVNRWQLGIDAWVNSSDNQLYKAPTEYCGDQSDIFIELKRPENERNYDSEEIEVEIRSDSSAGISKIELWVDGSLRETINNREYNGKIRLSPGKHEVYAKAFSRDGKEKSSGTARIGTGGRDWKDDPQPTPSSSPASGGPPVPPGLP